MAVEIYDLLHFLREIGASDLHLSPFSAPSVRVDGEIRRADLPSLLPDEVHILVYDLMSDEQKKVYEDELEIDFATEVRGIGRFRVNVFKEYHGDAAVFRAISDRVYTFEELGLPDVLKKLATREKGLILVTGPTGSGKTTTLNTVIDFINAHQRKHVITIEDPVEFIQTNKLSLIDHREVGANTHSFARALRSALREDPDVIVVGEMRDLETTSLAITAAETGHLVFGTLHTVNATKSLDRIIDQYPAERQAQIRVMLSESVVGVVSQILLKKKGGGRVAAFEVLIGTPAIANLIREDKTYQLASVLQTSARLGMVTMEASILKLVKDGLIEKEVALRAIPESAELAKALEQHP